MESHTKLAVIVVVTVMVIAASPANGGSLDIKIVLQGDTGLYLSRINRGSEVNPIEVAKSQPDIYCQLEVIKNADGTYSFLADNNRFVSRIYRGGINAIEAVKLSIDEFSKFRIIDHNNGKISLQADNELWWSRINRGGGAALTVVVESRGIIQWKHLKFVLINFLSLQ